MNNQHTIHFCQDGLEIELPQGFKFENHIYNRFVFRTKNYAANITLFISLKKYQISMNPPDEIEIAGKHQICIKKGRITDHAFFDAEELIIKEIILATNQVYWQWEAVFRLENIWIWLTYGDTRNISETVFMANKEKLLDSIRIDKEKIELNDGRDTVTAESIRKSLSSSRRATIHKNKQKTSKNAFCLVSRKKANSKLGGLPNLLDDVPWPCNDYGEAMIFVAQIDLAEVPRLPNCPEFPKSGALLFFYDSEYYMNLDKSFGKTIYVPNLFKSEHPVPESMNMAFMMKTEKRIGFEPVCSIKNTPLDEEFDDFPSHQLFGYPTLIQDSDMREECVEHCGGNIEDWILLLQLDGDSELPMIWGDAGRAYYWIRKQDLAVGNFSNTYMTIQSC